MDVLHPSNSKSGGKTNCASLLQMKPGLQSNRAGGAQGMRRVCAGCAGDCAGCAPGPAQVLAQVPAQGLRNNVRTRALPAHTLRNPRFLHTSRERNN